MSSILIIGANGGIGYQTVLAALQDGHKVTALVRNPATLQLKHPELRIMQGDILRPDTYEALLPGQDVVISAIGTRGGFFSDKPTTLYSEGNALLMKTMAVTGARRAFFISASAVEISPVLPAMVRWVAKNVIQKLLKHMYADLRRMETVIRTSGDIDWTIIRPPQLTDKPATGDYRWAVNSFLKNCLKISRADVAHFMLHHIDDASTFSGLVEVGY